MKSVRSDCVVAKSISFMSISIFFINVTVIVKCYIRVIRLFYVKLFKILFSEYLNCILQFVPIV